jgi:hypothetical protein
MLVALFETLDIGGFARDGFLGASQSNIQPREKGIYPEFLVRFEAEGESFLSWIVIADGSIILNRIQKDNPCKSTVFSLLGGGGGEGRQVQGHRKWEEKI